jgi:hypothetical protein
VGGLPKATKRRALIKRLKELGCDGPYKGTGDHPEYMVRGTHVSSLPNPHTKRADIGEGLLKRILKALDISHDEYLGQ